MIESYNELIFSGDIPEKIVSNIVPVLESFMFICDIYKICKRINLV